MEGSATAKRRTDLGIHLTTAKDVLLFHCQETKLTNKQLDLGLVVMNHASEGPGPSPTFYFWLI